MRTRNWIGAALSGAIAFAAFAGVAQADNEKGTATIKGKVVFDGTAPPTKALPPMNSDPVCAKHQGGKPTPDQATLVYPGKEIPYVFVYVKSGLKGKYDPPGTPAMIDQNGCVYHPHVVGMVAGQQLDIKSSDPTNHNVHALPKLNADFNKSQAQPGVISFKGKDTFTKPEMAIKIKCDVHSWMSAWCHVLTHPFFDATKDHFAFPSKNEKGEEIKGNKEKWGTFEIKSLPAGEYELEAWHETFGTITQKVTVKDGETKEIEFKLAPKKTSAAEPSREVIVSSAEKAK